MEIDWCICGKRVFDSNSFYCSKECASDENSKPINSTLTPPKTPPLNLHFSITITSNLYKASNAKAKVLSPPSSGDSSYSDSDLLSSSFASLDRDFNDYVYNYRNHGKEDIVDDDCYPSYYSTSNPIDIPVSRNQAQMKSEGTVDSINKGTFGDNSPFMP